MSISTKNHRRVVKCVRKKDFVFIHRLTLPIFHEVVLQLALEYAVQNETFPQLYGFRGYMNRHNLSGHSRTLKELELKGFLSHPSRGVWRILSKTWKFV